MVPGYLSDLLYHHHPLSSLCSRCTDLSVFPLRSPARLQSRTFIRVFLFAGNILPRIFHDCFLHFIRFLPQCYPLCQPPLIAPSKIATPSFSPHCLFVLAVLSIPGLLHALCFFSVYLFIACLTEYKFQQGKDFELIVTQPSCFTIVSGM